jgi:predicted nucleotidyltransferase
VRVCHPEVVSDDVRVIYETVHGSRAYGLAREGSDLDVKGVVVGPRAWYLGWVGGPDQVTLSDDHVRYELRRFIRLAATANPTVLELLWTESSDHLIVTSAGERLLRERDRFLSKRIAARFGGYAQSQLKRIRTHRSWLLSPPDAAPVRAQFGLPKRTVVPIDQLRAAEVLLDAGDADALEVSPNFMDLLAREKRYASAQTRWSQYQSWIRNRNPARSALEARHGYDTKHAMHLVRLQRMALEALTHATIVVRRPDRDELLAIRDGALTYDELEAESDRLATAITDALAVSDLPDDPDEAALDELCIDLVAGELTC